VSDVIRYELRDGVARLTLNRPDVLNALDLSVVDGLHAALDRARTDGARAGLLTGAGRAFCSGADLAGLSASVTLTDPADVRRWVAHMHGVFLKIHEMEIPWVAAVNGPAVGVGANLALVCDVAVAAESTYFYWAFVERGLSVDGGGTWLLPHLVGLPLAKRLALLPEKLPAGEAEKLGLVTEVVPDDQLAERADALAGQLAQGPTLALGLTKRALNGALERTFRDALEVEAGSQAINVSGEDVQEGVRAFLEKRAPRFKGR